MAQVSSDQARATAGRRPSRRTQSDSMKLTYSMKDTILKLKNGIPMEYKDNKLPAIFDAIDDDNMVSKLTSSGDQLLCKQKDAKLPSHENAEMLANTFAQFFTDKVQTIRDSFPPPSNASDDTTA